MTGGTTGPDLSMDRSAEPSTVVDAFAFTRVAELAAKDASGAIVAPLGTSPRGGLTVIVAWPAVPAGTVPKL